MQSVQQGSPADAAGIRAGSLSASLPDGTPIELGGDIIQRVAGTRIRTADELAMVVAAEKPGTRVPVELLREGKRKTLEVELAAAPSTAAGG